MTDITKENFQQEVLGPKVPVILFFASENSDVEDCKKQQEILQDIEKELNESVKVCVLNVDAQPFLALNYGITSTPSIVFMRYGLFQKRATGVVSKEEILNCIDELSANEQNINIQK